MKTQIKICTFLFVLLIAYKAFSQEYNDMIINPNIPTRTEYDAFGVNGQPTPRTQQVAIVYIDFPDGRRWDNGNMPTSVADFSYVANKDAIGEIGLTTEFNNYPVTYNGTTLYTNPCKYSWYDRWDMFFSEGSYLNNAHPDYSTHNGIQIPPNTPGFSTKAYGSFKEYWNEVSLKGGTERMFNLIPAITHTGEENEKLNTGIVNNYITLPNGKKVINYITLNLNKYGDSPNTAYFPDFVYYSFTHNSEDVTRIELMMSDAAAKVASLHNQGILYFDINSFVNNGGRVIFVVAGSHQTFKGIAILGGNYCIVRNMYNKYDNITCAIDGISNMEHEFAHTAFGWGHTSSGTYDLMNVYQTKDINCPTHPNPIFKMKEGWVTPVTLETSQSDVVLSPVETSNQVGVVTIYGKPSGAPDYLSGECYILENRKRVGFDKMLRFGDEALNFKGGLLVWHYSPYTDFLRPPGPSAPCYSSADPSIQFIAANGEEPLNMCGNSGNPQNFFAYSENATSEYKNVYSNRTYSQEGLKTGIELTNIAQTDYGNVNSNITFNLNYTISEPLQYSYVIYNHGTTNNVVSTSGRVFYHRPNSFEYYQFLSGARIDIAPNTKFIAKGVMAIGEDNNKVVFGSTGYQNNNESYFCKYNGMEVNTLGIFSYIYGAWFKNVHFMNIADNANKIILKYTSADFKTPVEIENITTDNPSNPNGGYFDVTLVGAKINKLNVDGISTKLLQTNTEGNINILNSNVYFLNTCTFSSSSDVILANCNVISNNASGPAVLKSNNNTWWQGLKLFGGGINMTYTTIQEALTGLSLEDLGQSLKIANCTFKNINFDIDIDNYLFNKQPGNGQINLNSFSSELSGNLQHIRVTNSKYILIKDNTFPNVKANGIVIMYCGSPNIINNTITGSGNQERYGIVSVSSYGAFHCNNISFFSDGIQLDNSQPLIYQNYIHDNGIGLYVTNNSNPILSPAYAINQTTNLAGYNTFENSAAHEIYIVNTENSISNCVIDEGYNAFYSENNCIISKTEEPDPCITVCRGNYWSIGDPGNYLCPTDLFLYEPVLTSIPAPPTNCQVTTEYENNSSMSQQTLLMGNALNAEYVGDYSSAAYYSSQLINQGVSNFYKKTGSKLLFINKYLDGTEISGLPGYYNNLMNTYASDTLMMRHFRNLKIESEVINAELLIALENIDNIISNAANPYELFYANIEKLRVLSLLDTNISGGDNFSNNQQNKSIIENRNTEISRLLSMDMGIKKPNSILKKSNDKQENNRGENVNTCTKPFEYLSNRIQNGIKDFNNKTNQQKAEIIKDKILYEILVNNYLPVKPPAKNKTESKRNPNFGDNIPKAFSISQNYPNPFNPVTTIQYSIPKESRVTISIYDITGKEVSVLVNEVQKTGYYSVSFNGAELSSGIYFYKIHAGNFTQTKRMVLIK